MVGIALSYTTVGIDAMEVTVECDRTGSMQNAVSIVGMPSSSVRESKDRVLPPFAIAISSALMGVIRSISLLRISRKILHLWIYHCDFCAHQ